MANRPHLTRSRIGEFALAIVDRHGAEGLTMRNLAGALGVTPMALYNHVAGRQALLDEVVDRAMGEFVVPDEDSSWPDRLQAIFTELRAVYLRHPEVVPLIQTTSRTSPQLLAPMESTLEALADAGHAVGDALAGWTSLIGLTNGHVGYQLAGHGTDDRSATGSIDAATFPRTVAAVQSGPLDWDHAFLVALRGQIAALSPDLPGA